MYGAIAGDIVGSVYEFANHRAKEFPLFREDCFATDDSIMTLAVAEALLDGQEVAGALRSWGRDYPDAGYGGMFRRWLLEHQRGPYDSFGNGSAMRVSPAGWLAADLDVTLALAQLTALPTHNHPEGIKGAQATAGAMWLARQGQSATSIRAWVERQFGYDLSRSVDQIRPGYQFDETCQKTVPESLTCALEATSFEDALRNAISIGGDSDTVGAIAGAVAEALFGGVPEAIRAQVRSRLDARQLAVLDRFVERAGERYPLPG